MEDESIRRPRRDYKDSVFRMLFSEKDALLRLYNALRGTRYTDPDELEINTIEKAIYLGRKNDISFIIHSEMYLYEHQSTMNPNMPLRNLFYLAQIYTQITAGKNLHGSRLIQVPRPHFIVFYNGRENLPETLVLKLSSAYLPTSDDLAGDVELTTRLININHGHNEELKRNCEDLYGYMIYVERVRENAKRYSLESAVEIALESCIHDGILKEFLQKRRAEVMSMSLYEYDQELHFREIAEDSRSEGWAAGKAAGKAETIMDILSEIGEISSELSARIMSEDDLDKLNAWIKVAIKVKSIDEFIQKTIE